MEKDKEVKYNLPKDIVYKFAVWLSTENYSRNTFKNYAGTISYIIGGSKNKWRPKFHISKERIMFFLRKDTNIVKQSAVKAFLLFLEEEFKIYISINRFPKIVKETKARRELSADDALVVINNIRDDLKLMSEFIFTAGLRISEGVRCKSGWFNFAEWYNNQEDYGEVKIVKAKRNKERIVPINPHLMKRLFNAAEKREENGTIIADSHLFDFNYARYIRRKTKSRKKDAIHLDEDLAYFKYIAKTSAFIQKHIKDTAEEYLKKKVTPHMLRISRATELDELGVRITQIRDLLGHSNISTTNTYLVSTPKKLKDSIREAESKKV